MEVTIHTTNLWLDDLMGELSWKDRDQAYQALRVVLHALRDRLPVEAVAALGVQLPPLVRGIYYEGWSPIGKPLMESEKENFLSHIAEAFRNKADVDPESVVRAVIKVLQRYATSGEIRDVKHILPPWLRSFSTASEEAQVSSGNKLEPGVLQTLPRLRKIQGAVDHFPRTTPVEAGQGFGQFINIG